MSDLTDLTDLVRPELVLIDPPATTASDVIMALSTALIENDFARPTLADAAIARELAFPTGLLLAPEGPNAAIPHADVEHVVAPAVAIAVLKTPVAFHQMDEPELEIPVRLVALLALTDAASHLRTLRELGTLLQNPVLIGELLNAETPQELIGTLAENGGTR